MNAPIWLFLFWVSYVWCWLKTMAVSAPSTPEHLVDKVIDGAIKRMKTARRHRRALVEGA